MNRKAVLLVMLVAAVVAGYVIRRGGEGRGAAVSLAYLPTAEAAPLFVALEEKLFEKHGLRPMVTELRAAPLVTQAVAAGHADVGFANTVSFLLARAAGVPLQPIGGVQVVDRNRVRAALLVRPGDSIWTVADLRGRTIAVDQARNLVELALRKVLRHAGVEAADVRFVEIPYAKMESALRTGRVDAVPLVEPYWTRAAGGEFRILAYPLAEAFADAEIAGWFTLESWRDERPEAARAVDRALREAIAWMEKPENEPQARRIIARYTGTDSLTSARMAYPSFRPGFTPERIRALVLDMVTHGFLEVPVEVDSALLLRVN